MVSMTPYLYRKSARAAIGTGETIAGEGSAVTRVGAQEPRVAAAGLKWCPSKTWANAGVCVVRIVILITVSLSLNWAAAQENSRSAENAQVRSLTGKKAKRGPRAIAVVEFLPNGGMRLVPVALWIDGRYYDASLYGANPEPMAVEPQTVYEAQSFGEPTGIFTVTTPKQVNGSWIADGTWQPQLAMDRDLKLKAAKQAAQQPKNSPGQAVMTGNADDGRPTLKRAPGSGGDSTSGGQSASPASPSNPSTSSDTDRPVMKRPANDSGGKPTLGSTEEASGSAPPAAQSQGEDHDPDRPAMKRPSASAAADGVTEAAAASNDNDPSRPLLSRNQTTKKTYTSATDSTSTKSDAPWTSAKAGRAYPAISDAGHYELRPLIYSMSSGERQVQEQQMLKLAMDEIRAFAAKRSGPAIPQTAAILDYDVRAFDLEYSSSPTLVLTAKLPMPQSKTQPVANFSYFVSIVARIDINGQAQKIFSSVTDSRHLDAFPRLELIDAIDADSNGRGDLLFRQYSDNGISYGLYRVSAYQMEKIFEGGSSM